MTHFGALVSALLDLLRLLLPLLVGDVQLELADFGDAQLGSLARGGGSGGSGGVGGSSSGGFVWCESNCIWDERGSLGFL